MVVINLSPIHPTPSFEPDFNGDETIFVLWEFIEFVNSELLFLTKLTTIDFHKNWVIWLADCPVKGHFGTKSAKKVETMSLNIWFKYFLD